MYNRRPGAPCYELGYSCEQYGTSATPKRTVVWVMARMLTPSRPVFADAVPEWSAARQGPVWSRVRSSSPPPLNFHRVSRLRYQLAESDGPTETVAYRGTATGSDMMHMMSRRRRCLRISAGSRSRLDSAGRQEPLKVEQCEAISISIPRGARR